MSLWFDIHDDFFLRVKETGAGDKVTVVAGGWIFSVVVVVVDDDDKEVDGEGGVGARLGEVKEDGSDREGDKGANSTKGASRNTCNAIGES